MSQSFQPGDFLVFQLEAGFALLRLIAMDDDDGAKVWHVAGYSDLFPDVETAETASANPLSLSVSIPHVALTNRAFESTQVARITNILLTDSEIGPLNIWKTGSNHEISDRSVRLLLGLR